MKMPPQALLLPASHNLATVMGCPDIASEGGRMGGSDECEVNNNTVPMFVTMKYAEDPWIFYLNHPFLMFTYIVSCFIFIYAGTLAFFSLKYLPKFKAKWVPKHCKSRVARRYCRLLRARAALFAC